MDEAPRSPELSGGDWELVKDLVYQWETDQPTDLGGWLAQHCPTDSIRQEVERLVRASATSGNFMRGKASEEHLGVPAQHPLHIGRYRVIEELGAGGLGIVYAAYDQALERKVAIKVLADQGGGEERRKRLRWDAKLASAAKHPNIVVIYDIGNDAGLDYIVMECVEGQHLNKLLAGNGLPAQTVLKYAIQIADALESAHRVGIIHRDLKPNNIMITEQGVIKILDFGLAKHNDPGTQYTSLPATIEGHFAGTVAYVSPEQAEGRQVDARGDIFSFGCILFEMLTGKPAFRGTSAVSILGSILHQPAPRLLQLAPQIDERFDSIVERCLRKKAEDRFATMDEVKARLAELVEAEGAPPRLSSLTRKFLIRIAVVAGVLLLVGLGILLFRPGNPPVQFDQLQVTSDSGLASYPAVSPDGQLIAYASDLEGNGDLDIWVKHWALDDARRVTTSSSDESSPSFSANGTELVYRSEEDGGGLFKMSAFGGPSMPVAPQGRDGRFSPDGKWIAYWKGEVGASLRPGSAAIYVTTSNGGPPELFPKGFDVAAYPTWSQSENKFIFLGRKTGDARAEWWIADWSDRSVRKTGLISIINQSKASAPRGTYYLFPTAWLASQTILFSATNRDAVNIFAVPVNSHGSQADAAYHWTDGTEVESFASAVIAPNGSTHTVYAALHTFSSIWRIPLNSAGTASGDAQPLITGLLQLGSSSLSTDGTKMVFSAKQPGGVSIQLADLSVGGQPALSTIKSGMHFRPVLSGDGKTVAWNGGSLDGYMMGVKGTEPEEVCDHCGQPTHLSFDGRKGIFESGTVVTASETSPEELILCIRGRKPRTLFSVQGGPRWLQSSGRFGPGERWIAFSGWHGQESSRQIVIVPATPDGTVDASQVIELTHDEFANLEPVWSPEGNRIYFLSNRDGHQCVWAQNVDPVSAHPIGPILAVSHFHKAGRKVQGPGPNSGTIGLSAARGLLVLTLTDTAGSIWSRATRP